MSADKLSLDNQTLSPIPSLDGPDKKRPFARNERNWQYGLLATAYWTTLAFVLLTYGAVGTTAVALATFVIFVLLPTALVLQKGLVTHNIGLFVIAACAFLAGIVWMSLQAEFSLGSTLTTAINHDTDRLLGENGRHLANITVGDASIGMLKFALPFGVFVLTLILFNNDNRAIFALRLLAYGGGLLAVFAVAQFVTAPHSLLFGQKTYYLDSLTAPFVNRNTSATFYGVVLLILIAFLLNEFTSTDGKNRLDLSRILDVRNSATARRRCLIATLTLATLTALLLTKSRAGIASTMIASCFFLVLAMFADPILEKAEQARTLPIRAIKRAMPAFFVMLLLGFVFVAMTGQTALRIKESGLDDARFCLLPGMVEAAKHAWPVGAGLTSFREVFPAFRDVSCGIGDVFDRAHNVYLEAVFGLGMAAFPIILIPLFGLVACYVNGVRNRRRFRFCGMLGLAVVLLVTLHSTVDFSLQIPGFSIWFAATTGILAAISAQPTRRRRQGL